MPIPTDKIAEDLIHFIIAQGLLHAECTEAPEHPVIVIWHESAVEHLSARLADLVGRTTPPAQE